MEPQERIVGVYSDRRARGVVRRLRDSGVPDERIAVGKDTDKVRSLRAEMREEMTESFTSPQAALVVPREGAKGFLIVAPITTAVGALLVLPFAFFWGNDVQTWIRILISMGIGAAAGLLIGSLLGVAVSVRGPAAPLAAERGVTVRVEGGGPRVVEVMQEEDPIRLDRIAGDQPVETIAAEDDSPVDALRENLEHPEGDWSRAEAAKAREPRRRSVS